MKRLLLTAALVAMAGAASAQTTKVTPLLSRDMPDLAAGAPKEGAMLTVEYAPGASDPAHRHGAYVFVYVLEGSVVMQVKDGPAVTKQRGAGETWRRPFCVPERQNC